MNSVRSIAFALLAFAYVATTSAGTIGVVCSTFSGRGPTAFARHSGKTKDFPRISPVQRKHLPLVKSVNVPADDVWVSEFPTRTDFVTIIARYEQRASLPLSIFASLRDRSPPLS
jgi:hypothetical protein